MGFVNVLGHGRMWFEACCRCKVVFALTEETYAIAMERREQFRFYCPHGHDQYYVTGETDETKLRRERDRLRQQMAQRDDEIAAERARRIKVEGELALTERREKRLKKRASAGVCPCCTRSFTDMARHMKQKHPEFVAENVVPMKVVA